MMMSIGQLRPEATLGRPDHEMQGLFQKWKRHGKV
jgi:hypothetical protein